MENRQYKFTTACETNNLDEAKRLYNIRSGVDIHADRDLAFRWCCYNNNLEMAKWLYTLGADIYACNNEGLRISGGVSKTSIVTKWLLEIGTYNNEFINTCFKNLNDDTLTEIIFDKGYIPTNSELIDKYKKYKVTKLYKLKTIIKDEYLIPDLWNVIYGYLFIKN